MKIDKKEMVIRSRVRGYSIAEISSRFCVSKSTASLWVKDIKVSEIGLKRIENRILLSRMQSYATNHGKKLNRISKANIEANKLLNKVQINNSLSLSLLAIMYWCEGSKEDRSIRFTNSDPNLIRMFLRIMRENFQIDEKRITISLHIHDYHDEQQTINFWSKITSVPAIQFNKVFLKKSDHDYQKTGYKGCIRINYHDEYITRVILLFAKKLMKLYI